ncbi:hypothetical protein RCL_jg24875.t1 [Rhizophagus clarus]|uniref:Uncharacterized protein n=1 Tax=Rhizophagus clarus TaxID=94130 RepID=A0A8H3LQY9_9GLOM|nr:hypothetical protein RCL_jg24875.t1 [Rhizophagus clarus]
MDPFPGISECNLLVVTFNTVSSANPEVSLTMNTMISDMLSKEGSTLQPIFINTKSDIIITCSFNLKSERSMLQALITLGNI